MTDPVPYLTASQVRDRIAVSGPALKPDPFTDTWVEEQIADFEDKLEKHTGDSYVPREATWTGSVGGCTDRIVLPYVRITDVTSCTVDGDTVTLPENQPDLDIGIVRLGRTVTPDQTLVFAVEYGHAEPPIAVLRATAAWVAQQAVDERAGSSRDVYRQGFDGGSSTAYVMPDPENGRLTGYDAIDKHVRGLTRYRTPGIA